jgi:hypothetical protein
MVVRTVRAVCPINTTEIYKVTNQTDADALNLCETFNGTISVEPYATNLISIPGVKHIIGDLWIGANPSSKNLTGMSILSMQSLVFVDGIMDIGRISNLMTLDLPALASVGQAFDIYENPSLSTVSLPNLTSVGTLTLNELPSLIDLNFVAGIRNITGYTRGGPGSGSQVFPSQVTIQNTGLISLEGLLFSDIIGLTITDNALKSLTLSLESFNCANDYSYTVDISRNYNMSLNLPNLTTTNCELVGLDDLSALNIPALSVVNGSVSFNNLTPNSFTAPKLLSVSDSIHFVQGNVQQINLPALQTVGMKFSIDGTPAIYLENGILLPNITNVSGMIVDGDNWNQPYCQILDNLRCRGLFTGYYSCGNDEVSVDSDPNNCQYTYPVYGWTRAKKLEAGLGISLGPLALLGFIWLVYHNIKLQRAEAAATRALENLELASTEQLPKYSQHDGDSGVIPPYNADGSNETASAGVSGEESDMVAATTQERVYDRVHGGEPDVLRHEDARSVPVSPLEEAPDVSQHMTLDTAYRVSQDEK